jgi:signal transduction histidine kinase
MRLGLRNRVALGFAAGALLLSTLFVAEIYTVSTRYLVDQRDRTAARQAVVNATLLSTKLAAGSDPREAVAQLRTGAEVDALLHYEGSWYSGAVGIGPADLPPALPLTVGKGQSALQRYATKRGTEVATGVPLASGGEYYEVGRLDQLANTQQALLVAALAGAAVTTLLGAALGLWAAGRVLRPLADVTRTATQLAGGDFEARIPTTEDPDIAPIAGSFNAMARTLGDRIHRDERFAADVSHELRSPLTTLTASLSVLEARHDELPASAQEATDLMSADLARFARLLEDLLDLSRDVKPLNLDELPEVDLAAVVEHALVVAGVDPQRLTVEGNPRVRGDYRRLDRVAGNLVENAEWYGGGVVAVAVTEQVGRVRLVVDDNGPGVAPEDQEVVFERFARGSEAARRGSGEGTGLGLSLVREHAAGHGGSAWYEDRPGGGARFVVELPGVAP